MPPDSMIPPVIPIPPPLSPPPTRQASPLRQWLAILLSLCLGLFLADAVISFVDASMGLLGGGHALMGVRMGVCLFAILLAVVVYGLMALTPAIPKRLFVPLALFYLVAELLMVPLFLFCPGHLQQIDWVFSLAQVLLGLWLLGQAQGGFKFSWRLVPLDRLGARRFSWRNLIGFVLANVFGLVPAVMIYLFLCTAGAVNHFSEGFMTLRPGGFMVQVRKYVRPDGKTIQLFPMSHVAESDFYQNIAQTFPTNSIILMEGVTDEKHLLKNKINYQRMARKLGLAEQHEEFAPTRGVMVPADIDVDQFTTNTLDVLNLVILIHTRGADAGTFQKLMQYSTTPDFQEQLLADLLQKRNQHLLEEIQTYLPQSEHLIVPWGVAHMPGIARQIQQSGFKLAETREYEVIRFHFFGNKGVHEKTK